MEERENIHGSLIRCSNRSCLFGNSLKYKFAVKLRGNKTEGFRHVSGNVDSPSKSLEK